MRLLCGHKGNTDGEKAGLKRKLEVQKKRERARKKEREREGLLTQQELSAKAGVRQGASVCFVCVYVQRRGDSGHVPNTMTRKAGRAPGGCE